MTDPIKAALDEAAWASLNAGERDFYARHGMTEPGPGQIQEAAQTIAVFLRALQDGNYPYPSPPWATGWSGTGRDEGRVHGVHPHRLAAAVEEAARHD